jgi:hypothetical protein
MRVLSHILQRLVYPAPSTSTADARGFPEPREKGASSTCRRRKPRALAREGMSSISPTVMTHCWEPAKLVAELQEQQFRHLKVWGEDHPQMGQEYVTDWYYYVFSGLTPFADGGTCA